MCLTAYTAPMARLLDPYCDVLLVGDSLGMALYGMKTTVGVDLEMMIRHTQAVMRGAPTALIVTDLPCGTYEDSPEQACKSAGQIMAESGTCAVKLEGGEDMAPQISALVTAEIPVMGHIGLLPQSVEKEGGYKIKGRSPGEQAQLLADARALEEAGAFAVVIEGTLPDIAQKITQEVQIPTIGIGASPACDGQILVSEDMLGFFENTPRFVRRYADLGPRIEDAVKQYAADVRERRFPDEKECYVSLKGKRTQALAS